MLRIRTFGGVSGGVTPTPSDGGLILADTSLQTYYIQGTNNRYYTAVTWPTRNPIVNATGYILYRHSSLGNRLIYKDISDYGDWGEYGDVTDLSYITSEALAAQDYNGDGNTQRISNWGFGNPDFSDRTYGYIPSYGEVKILFANWADFNTIVQIIGGDIMADIWSSTVYDSNSAWASTGTNEDRHDNLSFRHIKAL